MKNFTLKISQTCINFNYIDIFVPLISKENTDLKFLGGNTESEYILFQKFIY